MGQREGPAPPQKKKHKSDHVSILVGPAISSDLSICSCRLFHGMAFPWYLANPATPNENEQMSPFQRSNHIHFSGAKRSFQGV